MELRRLPTLRFARKNSSTMVKLAMVLAAAVLLGLGPAHEDADDTRSYQLTVDRHLLKKVAQPMKHQPEHDESDDSSETVAPTTVTPTTMTPTTQPPSRGPSPCTDAGPNMATNTMWFVTSSWHAAVSIKDCCDLCWADPTCNGFTYHPASLTQSCLFATNTDASNKVQTISGFWTGYFS